MQKLTQNPLISVIVLNYNGLRHLKTYLPALVATKYEHTELILADNASDDDSITYVKQHFPQIRILALEENYGYCGGNNRAAAQASGELLLFLNNDVRVAPNWLNALPRFFERYDNLAAAQPKILSDQKPAYFDYAGAAGGKLDRLGYPWCRGRFFDEIEEDKGQYDGYPERLFWASGAALCVRADVFKKAGGFDERFGFHFEEIDLCWRMQRMGHEIRYCPDAVVWHLGGGSLKTGSARKYYYNFRNSLITLFKNYPANLLFFVLFLRLFTDAAAGIQLLFSGEKGSHKAVWRAYRDAYSELPYWLKVRGELARELPLTDALRGFAPFSIAWQKLTGRHQPKDDSRSMPFYLVALTFFSTTRSDRGHKHL